MAAIAPRVSCPAHAVRCRQVKMPGPLARGYLRRECTLVQCQAAQVAEAVTAPPTSEAPPLVVETGKVCLFNATEFDQLTSIAGSRLIVVDVYTTWCGPCKMIAPELEKMAEELGDKMIMSKMDCTSKSENKKWAMTQNVKALPTFILFKDGKRVNDMTGAKPQNLRKLIDAHM